MLHVFIDTNVYLTFFSFAEDDLEELRKLHVAIANRELKLWSTDQVRDELARNREGKVADSLDALRKLRQGGGAPQMARNLPEFDAFTEARREFERQLETLITRLSQEYVGGDLAADAVLRELLDAAETVTVGAEIVEAARQRVDLGNPPGKKGSLSDAVNWECLLAACPAGIDMYIVTQDQDFVSRMDKERISGFLAGEWEREKGGSVYLYRRISDLFRDKFPDIGFAAEFEKELRVRRLIESPSFESTHSAVARLSGYTEFLSSRRETCSKLRSTTIKSTGSPGIATCSRSSAAH